MGAGQGLGDCLAVTDAWGEITWKQLAERSKAVALSLKRLGLTAVPVAAYPGAEAASPMVLMLPHRLESLVLLLGVLRQGYPLLPLSVTHSHRQQLLQRIEDAMQLFQPVAAVTDELELVKELKSHRPELQVLSAKELLEGPVEPYEAP